MRRLLPLSIILVLAGCSHATVWSQDTTGGVLTLHGFPDDAMHDAEKKMMEHCGAHGYRVVGRDTVVSRAK